MNKTQEQTSPRQAEEKSDATIVWESRATGTNGQQVVPFPIQREVLHEERTIRQADAVATIRIISSGFGGVHTSASPRAMLSAA
ncbi:hypothetical protein [Laceyella sacchari]|uniref:Uncharacterized protein n=1 Tax=Laceyella sacchari TaxID=37482 RepID=A0ABY5U417_LACSH|nr:hypothetical protein [Laceyella sacchari]UWE04359.1 hypothetical protein NYR52_04170 [Laceyella sacchari]